MSYMVFGVYIVKKHSCPGLTCYRKMPLFNSKTKKKEEKEKEEGKNNNEVEQRASKGV